MIDAHVHIFSEMRGRCGTGSTLGLGYGRIRRGDVEEILLPPTFEKITHTPEMLLGQMEWAGVDRAILLQGPFYGECNDYVVKAVRQHPDRLSAAAYLDPFTDDCRTMFESIVQEESFCAVKMECSEAAGYCGIYPDASLADPGLTWIWSELQARQLPLVFDLGAIASRSYQTDAIRTIAETFPDLKIVIAHMAQPNPTAEADSALWKLWEEQIALGQLPNIWFDIASLPAYVAAEGFPYPTATRYIRMVIERLGPKKILWGTDIPGTLQIATYLQYVQHARLTVEWLPESDRQLVLHKNAAQVYLGS